MISTPFPSAETGATAVNFVGVVFCVFVQIGLFLIFVVPVLVLIGMIVPVFPIPDGEETGKGSGEPPPPPPLEGGGTYPPHPPGQIDATCGL